MSYIPENLRYYVRSNKDFYPVDSTNEKTNETAKVWAGASYKTIDRANDPIKDIQLVGLEVRSMGGRAYKVLIDDLRCDLREDTLLDTIKEVGIRPGGYLNGKYIWAMVGSQMKLIRVGSQAHRGLLASTERKKLKRITKFEVGHVYAKRDGERWTYIRGAHLFRHAWRDVYYYQIYQSPNFVEDCGIIEDVPTIEECRVSLKNWLDLELSCMVQYNQEPASLAQLEEAFALEAKC